ncbi:MAG: hypothetical protein [Caudoviricetes sp.]|nr:MAG: hypothetical protein [Caudoviricetes sp.]
MKIDGIEVMDNSAWASVAYSAARKIIATKYRKRAFLAEHLYQDIVKKVGEPFDARTMGRVIRALSADDLICSFDVARAKTSNGSIKPAWQKVPDWSRK